MSSSLNDYSGTEILTAEKIEAVTERAAIIEEACGVSRYESETMAAELYRLTCEERRKVFPLPKKAGFEAVAHMADRGFSFLPWDEKEGRPALKWTGENKSNFTGDTEKLKAWQKQGFRRFFYLPALSGFIGFDIDLGHADGKNGLIGFYQVMQRLAGKASSRLPRYLRDLPNNFPCYVETPSGGLHLLFKYSGLCKAANLLNDEARVEVKYLNSGLSLGEKQNGFYILRGDPFDALELPPFLIELVNPKPKSEIKPEVYQQKEKIKGKPSLEKILARVVTESSGHNDAQKKFAWRAAYFGYEVNETLLFVKSRPDVFGSGRDTETVINHAFKSNPSRAAT